MPVAGDGERVTRWSWWTDEAGNAATHARLALVAGPPGAAAGGAEGSMPDLDDRPPPVSPPPGGEVPDERVTAMRAFGRYWAQAVARRMESGPLGTPYSLPEARVIFDLARAGRVDLSTLRGIADIDAGHLARIVHRFRNEGLVRTGSAPADGGGRGQFVELTERGREVFALLDRQSAERTRGLLAGLHDGQQREVITAMATIRRALSGSQHPAPFTLRGLRPGDLGWVVERHATVYAEDYGYDEWFEGQVAGVVAGFAAARDPATERAWIAEVDGEPVGCVFCVRAGSRPPGSRPPGSRPPGSADEPVARLHGRLQLLLVQPSARGLGVGRRLVQECIAFARRAGYQTLGAQVQDSQRSAERILRAAGFRPYGGGRNPAARTGTGSTGCSTWPAIPSVGPAPIAPRRRAEERAATHPPGRPRRGQAGAGTRPADRMAE